MFFLATLQEIDELCEEWHPEPMWGQLNEFQQRWLTEAPVLSSDTGVRVVIEGRKVLNMVSFNFLGLAGDGSVRDAAAATIEKYGVGSCGPRGFYGTIDVHLQLEVKRQGCAHVPCLC